MTHCKDWKDWIDKRWETMEMKDMIKFIELLLASQKKDNEILMNTILDTKNKEIEELKKNKEEWKKRYLEKCSEVLDDDLKLKEFEQKLTEQKRQICDEIEWKLKSKLDEGYNLETAKEIISKIMEDSKRFCWK